MCYYQTSGSSKVSDILLLLDVWQRQISRFFATQISRYFATTGRLATANFSILCYYQTTCSSKVLKFATTRRLRATNFSIFCYYQTTCSSKVLKFATTRRLAAAKFLENLLLPDVWQQPLRFKLFFFFFFFFSLPDCYRERRIVLPTPHTHDILFFYLHTFHFWT